MRVFDSAVLALGGVALLAAPAQGFRECRKDAVRVGTVCVDKYEASVWEIPSDKKILIKAVQNGNITSTAFFTQAQPQVPQRGATADDYGAGCPDTGNDCKDFYAVSIPGVDPSAFLTWFQAAAACRNAGKRLLTNQEWTVAAMGTPDPRFNDNQTTDCRINSGDLLVPVKTGSRSQCVSDTGAFDMVGNLDEWVADWGDQATGGTLWSAAYGFDLSIVGGDGSSNLPGALVRGGFYASHLGAGVFSVAGYSPNITIFPYFLQNGFQRAREP